MVLPSSMAPFSEKASAPLSSVRSLLRPALIRSTLGLLQTQPQLLEQTAYVRGVVDDAELFADDLGYPLARPYVSSKTVRWCSLGQKLGQSGTFFLTQAGRRPGSDPTPQALDTFFTSPLLIHWLTAPLLTPKASAISCCFHPSRWSSQALRRLPSRQSLACFESELSMSPFY